MVDIRLIELLSLDATDSSAVRMFHVLNILQRLMISQRKSALDIIFGLIAGFVSIIGILAFFKVPNEWPYIVVVSFVFVGIILWYWRKSRKEKGFELLDRVTRFSIYLDEARRSYRQIKIAQGLQGEGVDISIVQEYFVGRLRRSLCSLSAITKDGEMSHNDYVAMREEEAEVNREIKEYTNFNQPIH